MDAIQRLRAKAQANGKLETTKQQKVTVTQDQGSPVIEIEPASPEVVYVPYYDPGVVYGAWPYPAYPPYYFPPPAGWVVGGAIATGLAWGAAYAIGHDLDDFDWHHGNIDVDIDRNVNIDANRNFNKWEHNSYHRRGVAYDNDAVRNKFANANARPTDRKLDYRGRGGDQVLKPDNKPGGGFKPGGDNRPADVPLADSPACWTSCRWSASVTRRSDGWWRATSVPRAGPARSRGTCRGSLKAADGTARSMPPGCRKTNPTPTSPTIPPSASSAHAVSAPARKYKAPSR